MSCLIFCVFISHSCFGTIWNDLFPTKIAELLGLTVSISLDDSTTAGGAWHFCVGRLLLLRSKSGPVALSIITASVNWLSDKRYWCVRISHQLGPLSRTEQKSLWPQAVFRETLTLRIIFTSLGREIARQIKICRVMIVWDVYTGIFLLILLTNSLVSYIIIACECELWLARWMGA